MERADDAVKSPGSTSDSASRDPLAHARRLARLLDSAARVPGTGIRFGLDPLLGLVPGLGDAAGAAMSGYLILVASRLGVSRATIVRMLANVALDVVGGALPVLGDAFDVAFKSNLRNLALLEHAVGAPSATLPRTSRVLVAASVTGLALLAVAGVMLAVWVVRAIAAQLFVRGGG